MRIIQHALAATAAALIAFPVAASAQTPATSPQAPAAAPTLAAGKWTGTVTPPNAEVAEVTFDVATVHDTLQITIDAGRHGKFTLEDIKVDSSSVSFAFTPGPRVVCVLAKTADGAYAGDCTDDSGTPVPMTMVPPKKEAGSGS